MELHLLKLILVISNFSTLSFLVLLMVDHYKEQHNLASWGAMFNILSFFWLSLRGLFWLFTITSTTEWAAWKFYLLYWMPTPLEFGALMILPFYFAQVIDSEGWKRHWGRWIQLVYSWVLVSLIIFQALWAVVEAILGYQTEFKSEVFRCVTALCFFILTITQSIYGVQLLYLDKQLYDRHFITSREVLAVVNAILVLSFFSRSVYQLLALFHLYTLPTIRLQGSADVPVIIFVVHEFWNYVPTVLLIVTITSRSIRSKFTQTLPQTRGSHTYIDDGDDDGEDSDDAAFFDHIEFGTRRHNSRLLDSSGLLHSAGDSPHLLRRELDSADRNDQDKNNTNKDINSNKDAWLCDSDPQSYCLTSNLYFNHSGIVLKPSISSSVFIPSSQQQHQQGDLMNTSTVRGSRSGSATDTSHASSREEGDPLLSYHNNSNHSLQQERNNLFVYYQFQKVRADSEGSYGSLSNFKLNKFNLAMTNSGTKHHINPLISRHKPGPLPSIMDLTTSSDTVTNNADANALKKGMITVNSSRQSSSSRLEKEYELQVEPRSSKSAINANRINSGKDSNQISTNPNPNVHHNTSSHNLQSNATNNSYNYNNHLVSQAQHVPLPTAHATTNVANTTTTVNPRPTRPTPFLPFGSAYAAVESPTSSPTPAAMIAPHHHNNNNTSSTNNTTNNPTNQHLMNRSRTPGLSPKPPFTKQHPLDNTNNNTTNNNRTNSTTMVQPPRERKALIRRDSEAII